MILLVFFVEFPIVVTYFYSYATICDILKLHILYLYVQYCVSIYHKYNVFYDKISLID